MKINVMVRKELNSEFISDVLITAFDGNYGGCWYWAKPAVEDWLKTHDGQWESVTIQEREPDEGKKHLVYKADAGIVASGIERIIGGAVGINDDIRESIFRGVMNADAGEIDADGADCIMQAGIFDEIVYG